MSAVVFFGGSRSLPRSAVRLVAGVLGSVFGGGRGVAVGCARGVDAAVVGLSLRGGFASRLSVFAAFGPRGRGAGRVSAVAVVSSALAAGVPVVWWAGGGASWPLRVRLAGRSEAVGSCALRSGPGAGAVFFVLGGWSVSPGSWRSALWSARAGLPVVVFSVGAGFVFPRLGAGRWVRAGGGVWASGRRWVPA